MIEMSNLNRLTKALRRHFGNSVSRQQIKRYATDLIATGSTHFHSVNEYGEWEIVGTRAIWRPKP